MAKETKKSFVLRLDAKVYEKLEELAKDEFRSVNGQIEYILHQALKEKGRIKDDFKDDEKE